MRPPSAPPAGTVEAWCHALVATGELARKLAPPAPPDLERAESWERDPPVRRLAAPGRPALLRVVRRSAKTPAAGALVRAQVRARLVHTFAHHELQAAELFAWAVLAFPDTPRAFRRGLVRLACEELTHLAAYCAHLDALGHAYGDFVVRDWFWSRVAACPDPLRFVALLGVGLEGANLEHSARFADWFERAGDADGAALLRRVERDEVAHVAFARRWCEAFAGAPLDYDAWAALLPAPLTPALLRGTPLNVDARRSAGFDDAFLARLDAAPPAHRERGRDEP